jgi:hypothetical protein
MMSKLLPIAALVLGLSSGVAQADRGGGHDRPGYDYRGDHRGGPRGRTFVRGHRDWRGGGAVVHSRRGWNGGGRVYFRNDHHRHVVRRPIYISRPVIRHRYYNYYQRPALIVENYSAMPGYYWVAGRWTWDGYEWIWQPGHYEPDPNYVDPGYVDPGYADPYYYDGY